MGKLWIRYYGLPVEMDAQFDSNNGNYFDYSNRFKLTSDHNPYLPFSMFQQEMIIGRLNFTLLTAPGIPVIEDTNDNSWNGICMSTAEVNLYLAPLQKLLYLENVLNL